MYRTSLGTDEHNRTRHYIWPHHRIPIAVPSSNTSPFFTLSLISTITSLSLSIPSLISPSSCQAQHNLIHLANPSCFSALSKLPSSPVTTNICPKATLKFFSFSAYAAIVLAVGKSFGSRMNVKKPPEMRVSDVATSIVTPRGLR